MKKSYFFLLFLIVILPSCVSKYENSMLKEAKTPIEDLNKYKKDMNELLSRITQLENEKKELENELDTLSLIIEAKDQEQ